MLTDNGAEFGLEIAQIVKGFVSEKVDPISADIKFLIPLIKQVEMLQQRIDELEFEA